MRIFVDTSAFYALLDRDDENHQKAKKAWTGMVHGENVLVTSNYVLVETFALLQHRLGIEALRGFQDAIIPWVHVEFVSSEMHRAGVSVLLSVSRRNLSLVDCVSFEMMRALELKTAFVFDLHFKEQGFMMVPQ